ncbi:MAG TPA: tetratricopeptide repeat protein [Planktothrix sp.]|jgi:tetratricopeptide (TPR) repeat protein
MKSWESFRTSAERAESLGKLEHAESYWYAALEQAETEFSMTDPRATSTLESLSEILFRQGKYGPAIPVVIKTMEIFEESLGPQHSDVGVLCNNLAMLHHLQGTYDEAEKHYKRAMDIQTKALGGNHPELANLLANYSDLLIKMHRQSEAEHMRACIKGMTSGRWTRSMSNQAYRPPVQEQQPPPQDLALEYQESHAPVHAPQTLREPVIAAEPGPSGLPPGIARVVRSRRQQQDE